MSREIAIIRHGRAYWPTEVAGVKPPISDPANPPLTPMGLRQAEATGAAMVDFRPDFVIVSPFLRTAQTAWPTLRLLKKPGIFDVRMCEFLAFDSVEGFSGIDDAQYRELFGDSYGYSSHLSDRASYPAFPESVGSLDRRLSDLTQSWLDRDDWERIAFFGHGASVAGMVRALDGKARTAVIEPKNCSIYWAAEEGGERWRASLGGDVSHLEERGVPVTDT